MRELVLQVFSILLLILLTGCTGRSSERTIPTDIKFRADGILDFIGPDNRLITRIAIEIAESDSAQARGLMGRRSLPDRGGMLFVDRSPSERSFWMKNTPLPLDIIFIRADSTVANVAQHTVPYSEIHIESDGMTQYVVEVRSGFTSRYGIGPGTSVRWTRTE
jgi:uncharacterized protein